MRRNLGFGGLLVGIAVALAAAGCGGSSDESPTTAPAGTAPPTTLAPSTAEQVCGLLLDREVASVVSVDVTPVPGASNEPRACTWVTGDEPGRPVLRLSLESQQWLEPSDTAPSSEGLGAPCESGSRVGTVETDSDDRLYATCLVDGLAVSLYKSGTDRSDFVELLDLAVSRLGQIDRAAFAGRGPPECVQAWRAGGRRRRSSARSIRGRTRPPSRSRTAAEPRRPTPGSGR